MLKAKAYQGTLLLRHIGTWHETFDVTEGDPMFLPAEKRVSIW